MAQPKVWEQTAGVDWGDNPVLEIGENREKNCLGKRGSKIGGGTVLYSERSHVSERGGTFKRRRKVPGEEKKMEKKGGGGGFTHHDSIAYASLLCVRIYLLSIRLPDKGEVFGGGPKEEGFCCKAKNRPGGPETAEKRTLGEGEAVGGEKPVLGNKASQAHHRGLTSGGP